MRLQKKTCLAVSLKFAIAVHKPLSITIHDSPCVVTRRIMNVFLGILTFRKLAGVKTQNKMSLWDEDWSSQLWTQFMQLRKEAWKKNQDFNWVWTLDLAIQVRCSNQQSYDATEFGSWSIVCWYVHMFPTSQLQGSIFISFHFRSLYCIVYFIYIIHKMSLVYLSVLFYDVFRGRAQEDVEIKNPSNCTIRYGWHRLQGNVCKIM